LGRGRVTTLDYLLLPVIWVSISVSSILVLLSHESAWVCAFWRLLLSLPMLAALSAAAGGLRGFGGLRLREALAAVAAGAFLALHFTTWMESLHLISVALSTTLVVTYPAISAAIEKLVRRYPLSVREAAGLLAALAGVVTAAYGAWGAARPEGVALALVGAFAAACYFSIGRSLRSSGMGLTQYALLAYGSAAAWLILASAAFKAQLMPSRPSSWPYLLALAAVPMLGGHTLMNYLLKKLPTHVVTSVALGEPAGASVLAAVILGQVPRLNVVAGMAVTVVGVWLVVSGSRGVGEGG